MVRHTVLVVEEVVEEGQMTVPVAVLVVLVHLVPCS